MDELIGMGHGAGGRLSRDLLHEVILPCLGDVGPSGLDDAAVLPAFRGDLVFTTDAHVVTPLEFPGGDLGTLAVAGTVNDLAVMGARPVGLSLGLILEEGLPVATLGRILTSMAVAARSAGVRIACGDTKVVERGRCDGLYACISGVGERIHRPDPSAIEPGDAILLSGTMGDHGFTLLTRRKGFELEHDLRSDAAPVHGLIHALCETVPVRWMRDPTRGGVATALCELVEGKPWSVTLEEAAFPLHPAVRGLSEILGLDPLYSANEGKFLAVVPRDRVDEALQVLRSQPLGSHAAIIGAVTASHPGKLLLETGFGGLRVLGMLASDPLPRIC
jgi:hydrogenase expression/formation protein HypE